MRDMLLRPLESDINRKNPTGIFPVGVDMVRRADEFKPQSFAFRPSAPPQKDCQNKEM